MRRRPRDLRGMRRAVRRAGRRPERASSATHRSTANPGWRWPTGRCRSPTSCARKTWCCGPICCGRGPIGSRPKPSAPVATTPTSSSACCRRVSAPTATTPNPTVAEWSTPQAAIADFEAGRCFLLPPTWTQLDSLTGRTVADVLAVERQIVDGATEPRNRRRQLDFRVLRLRPLPPGPQSRRTRVANLSEFVSVHLDPGHPGVGTLVLSRPPTNAHDPAGLPGDRAGRRRGRATATTSPPSSSSAATRSSPRATTCPSCAR